MHFLITSRNMVAFRSSWSNYRFLPVWFCLIYVKIWRYDSTWYIKDFSHGLKGSIESLVRCAIFFLYILVISCIACVQVCLQVFPSVHINPFKCQPHKMIKHWNNSSAFADEFCVFDHFEGLALKGLMLACLNAPFLTLLCFCCTHIIFLMTVAIQLLSMLMILLPTPDWVDL